MSRIAGINNISFGATLKTNALSPEYRHKMEQVAKVFDKTTAEEYPHDKFELYSDSKGQLLYIAECHSKDGSKTLNRGQMAATAAKRFLSMPQEIIHDKLCKMLAAFHKKDEIYAKGNVLLNEIENLVRTEDNEINIELEDTYVEMWDALRQKGVSAIKEEFKQDRILKDVQIHQ